MLGLLKAGKEQGMIVTTFLDLLGYGILMGLFKHGNGELGDSIYAGK